MPEVDVWRVLADELVAGAVCALMAVAESRGSSPGRRGALMAVGPDGPLAGTIGGGVSESALVDRVAPELRSGTRRSGQGRAVAGRGGAGRAVEGRTGEGRAGEGRAGEGRAGEGPAGVLAELVPLEHREGAPSASGLVCGGSQVVVVCTVTPGDLPGVRRVIEALAAGRPVEWTADPGGWRVVMEGLGPGLGLVGQGRHWSYHHRSGPTHSVHVIGGGHVGSALAPLLVGLDFRVVLVEERERIDLSGIPAHERVRLDYEDLARIVPQGRSSFVAIMAHSHERDAVALAALEPVELGYLGLLGSRAKVHRLVGERPMPPWFHGPMGVPIGSATPAEIAVSVAAEMVAVRSRSASGSG